MIKIKRKDYNFNKRKNYNSNKKVTSRTGYKTYTGLYVLGLAGAY